MVTATSTISRLVGARDRGVSYVQSHQRADGAVGEPEKYGVGPYYKTLWAFAAAGQPESAHRLASWVVANVLQPDGDLAGPMRGKLHDNNYPYPAAWLASGAAKIGRFDLALPAVRFMLGMQRENGGLSMKRDDVNAVQDVLNAGQCGNACLYTGNVAAAERAGAFLRTVMDAQPHPERELFLVWKPGEGLRMSYPPERQYLHSIRADAPRQPYFNAGMAPAFLVRLAQATGDASWIDLGKRYIEIAFNVLDDMYETAQVGKVGWGAALLYAATGEQRYQALAERAGDAMVAQQSDTGGWDNTGGYVNEAIRQEVTAEFVVLLDEMAGGLAAR